ncbi:hypothetical protein RY27_17145 [Litorilinea aerophila]|nr:hypothetical protein RY27_17145 [Litorilinea aerophila]
MWLIRNCKMGNFRDHWVLTKLMPAMAQPLKTRPAVLSQNNSSRRRLWTAMIQNRQKFHIRMYARGMENSSLKGGGEAHKDMGNMTPISRKSGQSMGV